MVKQYDHFFLSWFFQDVSRLLATYSAHKHLKNLLLQCLQSIFQCFLQQQHNWCWRRISLLEEEARMLPILSHKAMVVLGSIDFAFLQEPALCSKIFQKCMLISAFDANILNATSPNCTFLWILERCAQSRIDGRWSVGVLEGGRNWQG